MQSFLIEILKIQKPKENTQITPEKGTISDSFDEDKINTAEWMWTVHYCKN